jgi:hypothetical protein
MISTFAAHIPSELHSHSGKVFYSGRLAWSTENVLYVLGVNPGGDPTESPDETVGSHTAAVMKVLPDNWSAYRDEIWRGFRPGTYGMAPRVLHFFAKLGLNPGTVPCSNLVFVRSRRENDLGNQLKMLADKCWPFHAAAIAELKPRVILCFGGKTGNYVRGKMGASKLHSEFVEQNNRRWRSQVFTSALGVRVVVATHPSIADWTTPATDPTPLIRRALSDAET